MFATRLLALLVSAWIITLATAISGQAPPATESDSTSNPTVLTNQSVIQIVSAKLPEEVIITKIEISKTKFDLPTPSQVELNSSAVSAKVVKAMMTPYLHHDAGVTSL